MQQWRGASQDGKGGGRRCGYTTHGPRQRRALFSEPQQAAGTLTSGQWPVGPRTHRHTQRKARARNMGNGRRESTRKYTTPRPASRCVRIAGVRRRVALRVLATTKPRRTSRESDEEARQNETRQRGGEATRIRRKKIARGEEYAREAYTTEVAGCREQRSARAAGVPRERGVAARVRW